MSFRILPLANSPEHAEGVAARAYALWGRLIHEDTGMSAAEFTEVIRSRAVTDRVPLTLIALAGDELAGSISLKQREDGTDPALSPWIGGLLVDAAWRGHGLGAALLREAETVAATLGYAALYLSCEPAVEPFYARSGWTLIRRTLSCGDDVALMQKRLA